MQRPSTYRRVQRHDEDSTSTSHPEHAAHIGGKCTHSERRHARASSQQRRIPSVTEEKHGPIAMLDTTYMHPSKVRLDEEGGRCLSEQIECTDMSRVFSST